MVTPNPSIDHTVEIPALERGEVRQGVSTAGRGRRQGRQRRPGAGQARPSHHRDPAGRGRRPADDRPPGAAEGHHRAGADRRQHLLSRWAEQDGTTTKLNEPGATLSPGELLLNASSTWPATVWLVAAGSLPGGVRTTSTPGSPAVAAQVPVAIDTSAALAAAIDAGTVIKPNLEELEEILGRELTVATSSRPAATCGPGRRTARQHGWPRRPADHRASSWWAGGPAVHGTVGAGDCTLSGYIHATRNPRSTTGHRGGLGAGGLPAAGSTYGEDTRACADAVRVVADPDPLQAVKDVAS